MRKSSRLILQVTEANISVLFIIIIIIIIQIRLKEERCCRGGWL